MGQTVQWFVLFLLLFSCSSDSNPNKLNTGELWSIKMADAVMERFDSLIYYNNPSNVKWQYDIAFLGQAMDKLGSYDPRYSDYMKSFIDYFVQEDGTVKAYKQSDYNLDHINPAKCLLSLYKRTGEEKYHLAIKTFVTHLKNQPVSASGGFWHKKIYPHQMWLDGIYMSAPFLAQYAREFNEPSWLDTVANQVTLIYNKTVDEETGLLFHAWDESRQQKWADPETGCSPVFWGRALGWYLMALVDILDFFPKDHPAYGDITEILIKTSKAVVRVADKETGLWYQVLDKGNTEGNYLEASCSAMFTYVFAKAAKMSYLSDEYYRIAEKSFNSFIEEFVFLDSDGYYSIKNICGSAGLGGDPDRDGSYEYYINVPRVTNDPKGVAPFILAAIELKQ